MKNFLLMIIVIIMTGFGCTKIDREDQEQYESIPTAIPVTNTTSSLSGHAWTKEIPQEIPEFTFGQIDKVQNLSSEAPVSYQPEKILFILFVSKVTGEEIRSYMDNLKKDAWTLTMSSMMTGNPIFIAKNGDYVISIEEDTMGEDTAYYYVLLSEVATNALR